MFVIIDILRFFIVVSAFLAGKLISRLKLPSILGWLIIGMAAGPHAANLLGNSVLDAKWHLSIILERFAPVLPAGGVP